MTLLLPFMLGAERYGLKLTEIQEVVEEVEPYYLPAAPPEVIAAVNVHGRILPVLDLALCLGFAPSPRGERMIVLSRPDFALVLAVHQIESMLTVDLEQATLSQSDAPEDCICGVVNWHGQMISLLDLDQLRKLVEEKCIVPGGDRVPACTDRR
ncbi:MAG: chemotaxis protein CheW [Geopsychrobacter sp.]|nr:chemotaxis protein CheW [Geopsychrobacter sp.]